MAKKKLQKEYWTWMDESCPDEETFIYPTKAIAVKEAKFCLEEGGSTVSVILAKVIPVEKLSFTLSTEKL